MSKPSKGHFLILLLRRTVGQYLIFGEEEKHDLYGVLTLDFGDTPFIGTMVFRADTDDVELPKGCCCLDFDLEGFYGYDDEFPAYLNDDGNHTHTLPEEPAPVKEKISKYLVCYDNRYPTEGACDNALGKTKNIPFPDQETAEVRSTHWFVNKNKLDDLWCPELKEASDPFLPFDVPLRAKGVELTATKNKDGKMDLKWTTDTEEDTAALATLCGNKLENGGTEIKEMPMCRFPSGGSPYTCTVQEVCDNYRVLETEYNGRLIVYEPVTVK